MNSEIGIGSSCQLVKQRYLYDSSEVSILQECVVFSEGAFKASAGWGSPSVEELSFVSQYYPDFEVWYCSKVMPELGVGRRIFARYHNGRLAGIVVAKHSREERKLCTIWVHPSSRNQGLAGLLVRDACEWLEDSKPLVTVPEERMGEFRALFQRLSFEQTEANLSYYRPGRTEFVFNGKLFGKVSG